MSYLQEIEHMSDEFIWLDSANEFHEAVPEIPAPELPEPTPIANVVNNVNLDDDFITYGTDSSLSEVELVRIRRKPGRPARRQRPGQVFKVSYRKQTLLTKDRN